MGHMDYFSQEVYWLVKFSIDLKEREKKLLKLQRLQKFEYSLFLRINYNGSD